MPSSAGSEILRKYYSCLDKAGLCILFIFKVLEYIYLSGFFSLRRQVHYEKSNIYF
jgi:hypothetical protein